MKQNPPNAHRSQIKMCEKRQTRNVQFRFMQNAFRILKPIQKSSKCISVFRSTGANAFAKIQMRLAYEDKRDLYCILCPELVIPWKCWPVNNGSLLWIWRAVTGKFRCHGRPACACACACVWRSYVCSLDRCRSPLSRCRFTGWARLLLCMCTSRDMRWRVVRVIVWVHLAGRLLYKALRPCAWNYSTNHVYLHRFSRLRFCVCV